MRFTVTKCAGELVRPCEPTPSGSLPLSSIDMIFNPGFFVESMHVFKHGPDAAEVIRQALSRALVPYYPMAGRVVRSEEDGELEVACTGEGVWFFEASANCSLEDVEWMVGYPLIISSEQLLPLPQDRTGHLAMMQVTQFSCGGFVVCVIMDHFTADGIGMAQFLKAVGEFTKPDLKAPSVTPVWCRDVIPHIPRPSTPQETSSPPPPTMKLMFLSVVDISLDHLNRLKGEFFQQYGNRCSTFDVLSAAAWQCRTRSIGLQAEEDAHMTFAVDVRRQFNGHLLPADGGYYGNCIYGCEVTAAGATVVNASVVEVTNMIWKTKQKATAEFTRWLRGENPFRPRIGNGSMCVTDWRHLGFGEVDYGWGKPAFVTPLSLMSIENVGVCIFVNSPAVKKSTRVVTQFATEEHYVAFQEEMAKFVQDV